MKFCLAEDIPVILLSSTGKYFGAIASFKRVNIVLQKRQFDMADDGQKSLEIAKAIVRAKITNEKVLLQRYVRKRRHLSLDTEIHQLNALMDKISEAQGREELMGIEGAAAARYFSSIRTLLEGKWRFERRQKQPPPDPVNSMLSYGYTLLFYNIFALATAHGFHPYVGFLHGIREGHPSLVSDLLEEFRAPVIDSLVLNLVMRDSLKEEDFIMPGDHGTPCLLKDEARKVFIKGFEGKMNSSFTHSGTGYPVDYRRCIDLQVQAMKKVVEGKLPAYEPLVIK